MTLEPFTNAVVLSPPPAAFHFGSMLESLSRTCHEFTLCTAHHPPPPTTIIQAVVIKVKISPTTDVDILHVKSVCVLLILEYFLFVR